MIVNSLELIDKIEKVDSDIVYLLNKIMNVPKVTHSKTVAKGNRHESTEK